jgi:hypothetical protein
LWEEEFMRKSLRREERKLSGKVCPDFRPANWKLGPRLIARGLRNSSELMVDLFYSVRMELTKAGLSTLAGVFSCCSVGRGG